MNKIEEFLKDVRKANIISGGMFEKLNEIAGRYKISDDQQLSKQLITKEKLIDFVNVVKNSEGKELELLAEAFVTYNNIENEK